MHDRRRRLDVGQSEHHGSGVDFLRRVQSFSIYFQKCLGPGRKALVSFGLRSSYGAVPALSVLTPTHTWCYDSKLSGWSPSGTVELVLQSSSHSPPSGGSQWAAVGILSRKVRYQKGFISTSSLKLNVQWDEIILTMEGNTEEQNNASPPRREELHLCLISSNTLSSLPSQIFPCGFISVYRFTFDNSTCTFVWLSGTLTCFDWVPRYQSSCKSDKAQQNLTSSPCCQIKLWDQEDLNV